jgi:hypothetical protein
MESPLMAFREGGWAMWVVLGLDGCVGILVPIALIVAIVARVTGKMRSLSLGLGIVATLMCLMPMCAGVGGYLLGMDQVEAAVAGVDPAMQQELRTAGEAEASNNLSFGFGSGCSCLLPAVLALMLVPPKKIDYDAV